jgi:acetylornithine deacetylase
MMTVEKTLADLVAINSVSSRSNAEIVSYLKTRCEALGLEIKTYSHTDDNGVEKINLTARTRTASEMALVLVGHTDTVPYDPDWADALRLTENDGKLLARGACDTKGFIAASLTAVERIAVNKLKQPLGLVFTADEEIGCLGAKRLAAARPFTARYAIVGEPTSLQPMRAGKGYCLAEITVHGREAHSAYPQIGASAIFRAARLIERIESIAGDLKAYEHPGFDPPYTTLNVGIIKGGTAKNVVAGECRFTLEWRTIPGQESDHVLKLVHKAVAELQKDDPELVVEIDAARADDSFETPSDSRLVKFLERSAAKPSASVAFGTEAPSMIALGAEAVVFGPGDIRVAHRTGEFVPIADLRRCVDILQQAIEFFCGDAGAEAR